MKSLRILAVTLPIVVMLGWFAKLELVKKGPKLVFSVTGYDPRDLLAGHFLTYRVNYGEEVCRAPGDYAAVICAADPGAPSFDVYRGPLAGRPGKCHYFIKGTCQGKRFLPDQPLERYYIPEKYSHKLATVPQNSSIEVSVNDKGDALVTDFLIDGKSLKQYLVE